MAFEAFIRFDVLPAILFQLGTRTLDLFDAGREGTYSASLHDNSFGVLECLPWLRQVEEDGFHLSRVRECLALVKLVVVLDR
jgi:hypothetical protein